MQKKSKIITTKTGMQIKKFKNSNDAVVGIVTAILIIGLIVAVISVIQISYVPNWMEQTESEHMNEVLSQFSQLKNTIDIQSIMKKENIPISTSITLGSKELPFLMSARAFGTLEILTDECTIIIGNATNSSSYSLGNIKYSSLNAYFLDQSYIYETGAVILSQSQGDIMTVTPSFYVSKEDNVTISFTIVNIETIGKKGIISGWGTYPIQTEYLLPEDPVGSPSHVIFPSISKITINTKYQNSWSKFINNTLINSGLNYYGYGTNFLINDKNDGKIIVDFITSSINVNLVLDIVTIGAQVAPGWIVDIK